MFAVLDDPPVKADVESYKVLLRDLPASCHFPLLEGAQRVAVSTSKCRQTVVLIARAVSFLARQTSDRSLNPPSIRVARGTCLLRQRQEARVHTCPTRPSDCAACLGLGVFGSVVAWGGGFFRKRVRFEEEPMCGFHFGGCVVGVLGEIAEVPSCIRWKNLDQERK